MRIKKTFILLIILLLGFSLSAANVLADGCGGGEDCLNCGEPGHHHMTGAAAGSKSHGCQPGAQSSSCEIENSRFPNAAYFFVSAAAADNHENAGITAAATDKYTADLIPQGFIIPTRSAVIGGSTPIYLRNLALLC